MSFLIKRASKEVTKLPSADRYINIRDCKDIQKIQIENYVQVFLRGPHLCGAVSIPYDDDEKATKGIHEIMKYQADVSHETWIVVNAKNPEDEYSEVTFVSIPILM